MASYRPGCLNSNYNLSFAGCGFLCVYYIGVISCIRRFAPQLYINRPVSGASSGALAGVFLICDVDAMSFTELLMKAINRSRGYCLGAFDPRFKTTEYIRETLERLLPLDAHMLCSGRLFISMTHQNSRENLVVFEYKTRDDLIRAILCSSFIPIFGGFVAPLYKGDVSIHRNLLNFSTLSMGGYLITCPVLTGTQLPSVHSVEMLIFALVMTFGIQVSRVSSQVTYFFHKLVLFLTGRILSVLLIALYQCVRKILVGWHVVDMKTPCDFCLLEVGPYPLLD